MKLVELLWLQLLCKLLIESGANVNQEDALTVASGVGHINIVKFLIEMGADVNRVDFYGKTHCFEIIFYFHNPPTVQRSPQIACKRICGPKATI